MTACMDICPKCQGTSIAGHPDSGAICDCNGGPDAPHTAQEAEMTHETLTHPLIAHIADGRPLREAEVAAIVDALNARPAADDLRAENERLREAYHRLEQQWATVCQITAMELREEAARAALRDAQGGTDDN